MRPALPRHIDVGMWLGATLGILAFLLVGLRPALDFGLEAGRTLSSGISHGKEVFIVVLFGRLLGVVGIGSLFIVTGAGLGTVLGKISHHATGQEDLDEDEEEEEHPAPPTPPAPPPPAKPAEPGSSASATRKPGEDA